MTVLVIRVNLTLAVLVVVQLGSAHIEGSSLLLLLIRFIYACLIVIGSSLMQMGIV